MTTKIIAAAVAAVLILIVAFASITTVNSGHVGVVKMLGAVQMEHLPEGFHLKVPFLEDIEEIDIRLRKAESDATAASQDLQVVRTKVAVQYSLVGPVVPLAYQQIGRREVIETNVVRPAILESVKAITAQYTAEALVTQRQEVKNKIQIAIDEFIANTLKEKDITGAITLANVAITDFDFSDEFNKAIEEKVQAEQEALKAENEKLKRVTQAEAAAKEIEIAADAEAYRTQVESTARAEAIEREAAALKGNRELIELRLAEKWDGTLPRVSTGDAVPLINIDALQ